MRCGEPWDVSVRGCYKEPITGIRLGSGDFGGVLGSKVLLWIGGFQEIEVIL